MARTEPSGIGGSGRHRAIRDIPGKYRSNGLRGSSVLRKGVTCSAEREIARGEDSRGIRSAALSAGQNSCGASGRRGDETRNVAAFARKKQPDRAVECAGIGLDRYGRHGSLPIRYGEETSG